MFGPVLLVAFVVLGEVKGFMISVVTPEYIAVNPGQSFTLMCGTDSHYEHCDWKHPGGTKACNFEWKHISGSVKMQECDYLSHRISFTGDYSQHECGITVSHAEVEDIGLWTCEVEQYVWGDWVRGTTVTASINVTVVASTTPPPSPTTMHNTTTTTMPTTIPSPTTPTTIPSPTQPTTIPSPTKPTTIPSPTTPTTTPSPTTPTTTLTTPMTTQKQPPGNTSSRVAVTEQTTTSKPQGTGGELSEPSVVPHPVPRKGRTEKSLNSTPAVVGVLVFLVVIGVLLGVVFYYRKRNVANGAVHYKPEHNDTVILI